jgi:hypothetical protein
VRELTEVERSRFWRALRLEDGRQVVLLDYPDSKETRHPDEVNRNLLCLDAEDHVVWRVKPPLPFQPTGDPFVHIETDDGLLKATRFFGDICEINTSNGLAKIVGWTK